MLHPPTQSYELWELTKKDTSSLQEMCALKSPCKKQGVSGPYGCRQKVQKWGFLEIGPSFPKIISESFNGRALHNEKIENTRLLKLPRILKFSFYC